MKFFVNDTNILIDLAELDLLNAFAQLDVELHTTDFIIAELEDSEQKAKVVELIDENLLFVSTLNSMEMVDVFNIQAENNGLSLEDCSVWYYTKKHDGILLTGDGKLRKQAKSNGLLVKGIIYIFDELILNGIISPPEAIAKAHQLLEINERLPKKEIHARIESWEKI